MLKVIAVVVTFEADPGRVFALLDALVPQVNGIILIDNASIILPPTQWEFLKQFITVQLHVLPLNAGVAAAQNRGISLAIDLGASYILFFDHDSLPKYNMVESLLLAFSACNCQIDGSPVGAVNSATVDMRTGQVSSFVCIGRTPSELRARTPVQYPIVNAAYLISSGMLVPTAVIEHIGGLRSEYFIDHVDHEWCFRARAAGYRLVGLEQPLLTHSLGDEVQKVWLFRERHVSTHAPLRDYYMARNTLAMIKGGNLSLAWSAHFLWRIVQFFGFYVLLSNNKRQHLKMLFLGLLHGLRGINGKLNPATLQTESIPRTQLDPDL